MPAAARGFVAAPCTQKTNGQRGSTSPAQRGPLCKGPMVPPNQEGTAGRHREKGKGTYFPLLLNAPAPDRKEGSHTTPSTQATRAISPAHPESLKAKVVSKLSSEQD